MNIGIGEAIIVVEHNPRFVSVEVEMVAIEGAPTQEAEGNYCYPSYHQMERFCSLTELRELFYNTLDINNPPGQVPITNDDLDAIKSAKDRWIPSHTDTVQGWNDGEDDILARLIWFEFWFGWALINCKNPIMYFS